MFVKVPISKEVDGVTKIEFVEKKQTVEDLVPVSYDEVKPTVTTADGKLVAAEEAKKRLSAGAITLVSANGKPVGEPYLKLVKPDTLVLSSAMMVHPMNDIEKKSRDMLEKMKPNSPSAPPPLPPNMGK